MKKVLIAVGILIPSVHASAAILKMASGQINFTAVGSPGILKIRGNSKDVAPQGQVELKDGEAKGEFSFDLANLDTGIELRDRHMKDKYLEVEKYPRASLLIQGLKISDADLQAGVTKDFTGQLTLHGETKTVTGKFEVEKDGKVLKAQFPISVSEFKIDVPRYMGMTISEQVDVEVEGRLDQAN